MTELIENAELWSTWKFKMPVIMNSSWRGRTDDSVVLRPFRYLSLTINESESIQLTNNSASICRK